MINYFIVYSECTNYGSSQDILLNIKNLGYDNDYLYYNKKELGIYTFCYFKTWVIHDWRPINVIYWPIHKKYQIGQYAYYSNKLYSM